MTGWICNRRRVGIAAIWLAAAMTLFLLTPGTTPADETARPTQKQGPIQITADRLVSDSLNRTAEFSGHVRVVQGNTTIMADRLKVVYQSGSGLDGRSAANQPADSRKGDAAERIERIEAEGHVRIEMDGRIAESNRAVYRTKDRTLVLTGPGARVTSGKDVVESSKITFYRDSGNVEMVGGEKGQVKAILRSNQRGLN